MTQKTRRFHRAVVIVPLALLAVIALLLATAAYLNRYTLLSRPAAILHEQGAPGYIPTSAQPLDLEIKSPQAFVYGCDTQTMLYQKGEGRVVYPASTTKLLTALCALEHLSPGEIVTPGDELSLVGTGSSVAYIKQHHSLTVEMLIEAMLLPSGNDAAYVLAAAAGNRISGGSVVGQQAVAVFVQEMASYGARIGLVGTQFTTPDGLSGNEHYSTVEDIVLIARLALQNDIIRRYAALSEDDVTYASGHTNHWVNTNEMLHEDSPYYHASVTGLKTGSLEHNYCLICTVEQDGVQYILGVFGAWEKNDRYEDALSMIEVLLSMSGGGV